MALGTYSDLKAAIQSWMDRTDISGSAADFVTLAEARLNRLLRTVGVNSTLTGVVNSRSIDVSALNVITPVALFINDTAASQEYELVMKPDGEYAYGDTAAFPTTWSYNDGSITFDVPLDQAYSFRFRNIGRFALSDASPTNDLLTDNPDIYLAASIVWGGVFVADDQTVARWAPMLDVFVAEQRRIEERSRRGKLTVDPSLSSNHGYLNEWVSS